MAGFKDKVKKLFKGNKGSSKRGNDQSSIQDRYGVPEQKFQKNPLFEKNTEENEFVNPLFGMNLDHDSSSEEKIEPDEVLLPKFNFLNNVGGLPTKKSIEKMAQGLKLRKMWKYKQFSHVLDALEDYQQYMQQEFKIHINEAKLRQKWKAKQEITELTLSDQWTKEAFERMKSFVLYTEEALKSEQGYFARRSSSVQKFMPILANLLVQAYGVLPKLANLQYEIAPYVMATDHESFTLDQILNHQVTAGRSGGLAMRGTEEDNGTVALNPDKMLEVLQNEGSESKISEMRRDATEKARMGLKIPMLPIGYLKDVKKDTVGPDGAKSLKESAKAIADSYIADLRVLMRALDDTAESHEGKDPDKDRMSVHDKQAEHFRMSKLLYRVIQNRELLEQIIIHGMPEELTAEYDDLEKLQKIGGLPLSYGVATLNEWAKNVSTFATLTDENGNDLQKDDYKIGGGKTSISILDFKNRRVLRAAKKNGQYMDEADQSKALNGINDEAVGKVAQFLGFNVSAQSEATGFVSKDKNGESHNVFGGSIMEMADGVEANYVKIMFDSIQDSSRTFSNEEASKKQGRLFEDFMKMNALDYIVMHGDRNAGNFMINLDAAEGQSMVTAIDNDMVFGYNAATQEIGRERSIDALVGINDRVLMDFGSKLKSSFPMMTQGVKDTLEKLDLEALNEMLMPYVDRVARMAAVHRAGELKKLAEKVPVCDLSTQEGIQIYLKELAKSSLSDWMHSFVIENKKTSTNVILATIPNILMRMLLKNEGLATTNFISEQQVINIMKRFGFSKQETIDFFLNNVSSKAGADAALTKEQLMESEFGRFLEQYDSE